MLDQGSRLSGAEIASQLFGKEISGKNFWISDLAWKQMRTSGGNVIHEGDPIHPGLPKTATATGKIRNDLLCEMWQALSDKLELCVGIFRVSDPNARLRWGNYIMVTDTGPQPFS